MTDWSGHIPEVTQSPIRDLVEEMVEKTQKAREEILLNLISNPGVVATFGDDFVVEFGDIEIETLDDPGLRDLNEYGLAITQKWRIRRKEQDDSGPSLGRDPGGEKATD